MKEMWSVLVVASGASFALCGAWFLTAAKRITPITFRDAKIMWKMHKISASCACHKWQPITYRKGKIVGFECECGYKYKQKRPLVSRILR